MSTAIGSLIDAASSFGISVYNNKQARKNAEWQRDVALEQWNMENQYNLPSNQMARLRDAGLNPNLAYSSPQGSAGSMNAVSAPQTVPMDPMTLSTTRLQNSQADLNRQDTLSPQMQQAFKDAKLEKAWNEAHAILYQNSLAKSQTILNELLAISQGYQDPEAEDFRNNIFRGRTLPNPYDAVVSNYTSNRVYGYEDYQTDIEKQNKGEKPSYHFTQFVDGMKPALNVVSHAIYGRDFEVQDWDAKKHCLEYTIRLSQANASMAEKEVEKIIEEITRLQKLNQVGDDLESIFDFGNAVDIADFLEKFSRSLVYIMLMKSGYR